jgi:hypothetical protein
MLPPVMPIPVRQRLEGPQPADPVFDDNPPPRERLVVAAVL